MNRFGIPPLRCLWCPSPAKLEVCALAYHEYHQCNRCDSYAKRDNARHPVRTSLPSAGMVKGVPLRYSRVRFHWNLSTRSSDLLLRILRGALKTAKDTDGKLCRGRLLLSCAFHPLQLLCQWGAFIKLVQRITARGQPVARGSGAVAEGAAQAFGLQRFTFQHVAR